LAAERGYSGYKESKSPQGPRPPTALLVRITRLVFSIYDANFHDLLAKRSGFLGRIRRDAGID
jgi:hypothetical protein